MFRLTLRLVLPSFLFLSAALFLIRAQPYDNRDVEAFLFSDACLRPCFMGIQPGVTTPQQALNQLRSTDLISHVGVSESLETIAWFWNEKQASLMDNQQIPALFYDRDAVSTIGLYTRFRLGDVLIQLDQLPGNHRVAIRQTVPYDTLHFDLYYLGNGYILNAIVTCQHFWDQPTHFLLGARPQFIENQGRIVTSLNKAKHQIDATCRRRNEQ